MRRSHLAGGFFSPSHRNQSDGSLVVICNWQHGFGFLGISILLEAKYKILDLRFVPLKFLVCNYPDNCVFYFVSNWRYSLVLDSNWINCAGTLLRFRKIRGHHSKLCVIFKFGCLRWNPWIVLTAEETLQKKFMFVSEVSWHAMGTDPPQQKSLPNLERLSPKNVNPLVWVRIFYPSPICPRAFQPPLQWKQLYKKVTNLFIYLALQNDHVMFS